MKRFEPGGKLKNYGVTVGKFSLVLLLPVGLFFYRNFDYSSHLELCLFNLSLLGISAISSIAIIFRNLIRVSRLARGADWFWIVFPSLILFLSFLFRNEILVLKETIFFRMHRSDFSDLAVFAENTPPEKDIEDTYIEIPKHHKEWSGESHISVFKDPKNSLRLVALFSRPNTLFTYLPDHKHQPQNTLYFQYGYGVNCFYELADHWFVCSISR